jgi:hypothetical protein
LPRHEAGAEVLSNGSNGVRRVCLAVLVFAFPSTAFAEYPYSGYFTVSITPLPARDIEAQCSLKFFIQYDDGRAEDYFLDVNTFRTSKKLIFVRSNATDCSYNAPLKTEECSTTYEAVDRKDSFSIQNYLQRVERDYLESVYFRSREEYSRFIASPDRRFVQSLYPTTDYIYNYRCPNHSVSSLAPYLQKKNTLTDDQTFPLQTPLLDGIENLREVGEEVSKILKPAY